MNTHDIDIELPAEFRSGNDVPVTIATIKRERMEEILRAAVAADRKRRGNSNECGPVAYGIKAANTGEIATVLYGSDLDQVGEYRADLVVPLYTAPQPATPTQEPVGYFYQWELDRSLKAYPNGFPGAVAVYAAPQPADPVEVLSKDEIREVFLANGFTIKPGHDDLKPYVYEAAREIIALAQGRAGEGAERRCDRRAEVGA